MRKKILSLMFMIAVFATSFIACGNQAPAPVTVDSPVEEQKGITYIDPVSVNSYNDIVYSTLNSRQKAVYDTLLAGYQNLDSTIAVECEDGDVEVAHKAIISDHPEVFYVNGFVTDASTGVLVKTAKRFDVYPNYTMTKEDADKTLSKIKTVAEDWMSDLPEGASDYEISKYAFETIIDHVVYNKNAEDSQTMISSFLNEASVCGGYSQAYSYILQSYKIPSCMITGQMEETAHSWNITILDGAFYATDLTNGDSFYKMNEIKHDLIDWSFLNINPDYMPAYGVSEMFNMFKMRATDDNYYVQEGLHISEFDEAKIDAAVGEASKSGAEYVTLRFDERPLEAAKAKLLDIATMQQQYGVTHTRFSETYGTITLFFNAYEDQ